MLPKALVEMALGLPNVLFTAFFAFNEIDKVFGFTVSKGSCIRRFSLVEVKVSWLGLVLKMDR